MTCNIRCQHSKKDKKYCKCSCSGKNHAIHNNEENKVKSNHLQLGDLVRIKEDSTPKDRSNKICFVEDLLGAWNNRKGEQVSLYQIDGDYAGDYFEDEFEILGKKISEQDLLSLIEKYKDSKGLINDFQRVLDSIRGNSNTFPSNQDRDDYIDQKYGDLETPNDLGESE